MVVLVLVPVLVERILLVLEALVKLWLLLILIHSESEKNLIVLLGTGVCNNVFSNDLFNRFLYNLSIYNIYICLSIFLSYKNYFYIFVT